MHQLYSQAMRMSSPEPDVLERKAPPLASTRMTAGT